MEKRKKKFDFKKFLNRPLVKAFTKSIPIIGDISDNMESDTFESPQGTVDNKKLIYMLVRFAVLVALLIAVLKGGISMEQAEQAKEFLQP